MHFLVVDPNVAFATLLSEELTRLGYEVTTCASAVEAAEAAQTQGADLALLDMALEEPDALSLARQLRTHHPTIRLVLIPMMGEEPVLGDDAPPIQGVLPKPFFLPELPDRIQAALDAPLAGDGNGRDPEAVDGDEIEPGPPEAVPDESVAPRLQEEGAAAEPHEPWREVIAPADGVPRGLSRRALRANQERIEAIMRDLAAEIGADGVLLTCASGVLAWAGSLDESEIGSISTAVLHSWEASAEVARILGREELRFEQSIAGGSYLLYALNVHDAILAVTVSGSAPLGLLRHRARAAGERIAKLCAIS